MQLRYLINQKNGSENMENNVMLGVGFMLFIVGSCLADSESFIPCLVFAGVGAIIVAVELYKNHRKGEKG